MRRLRLPLIAARLRWAAVAAVAGLLLVGSLIEPAGTGPGFGTGPFGVGADKYVHALSYAGLAAVLAYAVVDRSLRRPLAAVVLTVVGFGLAVELLQWPVPYRTASAADAVANAVGASLVAAAWWVGSRFLRVRPLPVGTD